MADDVENASNTSEFFLNVALFNARNVKPELPKTGYCYNCHDPVPSDAKFCDTDCRSDWEMRKRNR